MTEKITFIQTTGVWWDHRYFFKQMPALANEGACISYIIREDKSIDFTKNKKINIKPISLKKAKYARITGGLNLFFYLRSHKQDAVQICNVELLPLGIFLSLFTKTAIFYDCREDHYHAMLHGKVWFPKPIRYILAFGVNFFEFLASKTFRGFVDSDPAIYNFHKSIKDYKKMIFYNMALKSQFNAVDRDTNRLHDFVVLGSMSIRTGVLDVVKAFSKLINEGHTLKLKLIGDPTFDKDLWKDILSILQDKKVSEAITITGKVPYNQVPFELATCKIGIIPLLDIPKFRNNIATKQFEYMASEMPIISSSLPPQQIFIKEDFNGTFYKAGDVEELKVKMISLIQDQRSLIEMAGNAKRMTETEWSSEKQLEKYINFYKLRVNKQPYTETQKPPFDVS